MFNFRWEYMHEPTKGTKEAEMLEVLRNPKEWIWDLIERKTHQYWVGNVKMEGVFISGYQTYKQTLDIKTEQQHSVKQTMAGHILTIWLVDSCWLTTTWHDYWLGCNELSIIAIGCMDSLERQCLLLWQCYLVTALFLLTLLYDYWWIREL